MPKEKKMRRVAAVLTCLLAGSALVLLAQEGHPLTGTWHGDYGTSPTQRTQMVFLMHWDSKKVDGKVNPGANAIPLKVATLDATKLAHRGTYILCRRSTRYLNEAAAPDRKAKA